MRIVLIRQVVRSGLAALICALLLVGAWTAALADGAPVPEIVDGTVVYGRYEQDGNLSNGPEPIEWIVLEQRDGQALLISRYALDGMPYHSKDIGVTWAASALRERLNSEFLQAAFTEEEQARIPAIRLENHDNPTWHTNGGASTEDRVFLLSVPEAKQYFPKEKDRTCSATAYARERIGQTRGDTCAWWLRTPGGKQFYASFVNDKGYMLDAEYVTSAKCAVRPAIFLDLTALPETPAPQELVPEEHTPEEPAPQEPAAPAPVPEEPAPQEAAAPSIPADAELGDVVVFGSYEQDGILSNGPEPIEWIVAEKQDSMLLLLSRYSLACRPFHSARAGADWKDSDLRHWLNGEFADSAFGEAEQSRLIPVTLRNVKGSAYVDPTTDTVFLPSAYDNALRANVPGVIPGGKATAEALLGLMDAHREELEADGAVMERRENEILATYEIEGQRLDVMFRYDGETGSLLFIAVEDGVETVVESETFTPGGWWLRDSGYGDMIAFVDFNRGISGFGRNADDPDVCVRPAVWVSVGN